ncbi:MAG: efflux RND transporter periplasmic adaptor subunit [Rhodospirillales bacterium]|nr:efflux RND transporter periplasmic adaptor subunit [Rhodospirillales bacterium]
MAPESGFVPDSPRRLSDGSFFVPKPAQRLLTIRNTLTGETEVPVTVQLVGQIVADPNGSGQVQSSQRGRIEPTEEGLPYLGTKVSKGQILAYLTPSVSSLERSTVNAQVTELASDIYQVELRIARLKSFFWVPFREGKLRAAEIELENLRKRYTVIGRTLLNRLSLRASTSGVISVANVVTGQIVEAREIVFEIVDPDRLWVQATAIDPAVADRVTAATALTPEGTALRLEFLGRGPLLQQQATLLLFRVSNPSRDLAIGKPVTVIVQTTERRNGIIVPQESVVRAGDSEMRVWEQISAERFVPRPVRIQPLDENTTLILAGIAVDKRIVTRGAALLNQVR